MNKQNQKIFISIYVILLFISFFITFGIIISSADMFLGEKDISKILEIEGIENITRISEYGFYRVEWEDNGNKCSFEIYNNYKNVLEEEKYIKKEKIGTYFKYRNIIFKSSTNEMAEKYYKKIKEL